MSNKNVGGQNLKFYSKLKIVLSKFDIDAQSTKNGIEMSIKTIKNRAIPNSICHECVDYSKKYRNILADITIKNTKFNI